MLRFAFSRGAALAVAAGVLCFDAVGASAVAQDAGYDPYATQGSASSGSVFPYFSPTPVSSARWVATVSANVNVGPSFIGSDKYTFTPYPLISIRRGGQARRPSIPGDGFQLDLLNHEYLSFGPVGRYKSGRYFANDRKLFGLRKLPWTVEGGAFVEVWPTHNLRGRVEARHGFRDEDGWVVDLAADFVQPFGQFTFTVGPRASWASGKSMRNTFGVNEYEASLNNLVFPQHGLYAYKPESGFQSAGAATSLAYRLNDAWSATATASYSRLVGDAGRSPIVRRLGGERNQFNFGLTAAYSFGVN
ncbi:outer membrane scaffolding protein for murein synthesis (MipA/OmpV family) [Pseudochelatococcus lubricantis]|uniref:Outer membrane scaffolding protein for murein synthesis (MipA/OmpV family) n=1 Tax=Pseudochelatococcus lubricantis TaxID=1538102 RepID=A0ABX0V1E5_9HYPH|nr:outer membrane scaffolding protein for murein synthesis (MipA/OmpV family) [Pseudochelatococcus lubricantis]